MNEQKRILLAIVLSGIVIMGYQLFFVKPVERPLETSEKSTIKQEELKRESKKANSKDVDIFGTKTSKSQAIEYKKEHRTISIFTPLYKINISESGAAIKSFELNNYKETNAKDSQSKELVDNQLEQGTLFFDLKRQFVKGLSQALYAAKTLDEDIEIFNGQQSLEFVLHSENNIVIKKIFTFDADSYIINCDIIFQNMSNSIISDSIVFYMPGVFNDEIKKKARFAFVGPMLLIDDEYTTVKPDDIKEKDTFHGNIEWAGFTQQYFMTAIMPKKSKDGDTIDSIVKMAYVDDIVTNAYIKEMKPLEPGKQSIHSFEIYMGPKSYDVMNQYDNSFKKAINFGFFNIIAKPLLIVMNLFYKIIPNYGIAIILLTILIKLIFWPLGTKSYKSMSKMKKIQPLMVDLRAKYKDDKQKLNKETMALYRAYKVNPASGCLPLLIQMPIFFALWRMLYQAIELRHAPFVGWMSDLSAPERLFNFNFSIPMMQEPSGIPMLTLLMGASFFIQQKMSPTQGDPTQAKIMMLMPLMMTVLFINFPAGLVLYMFVNNLISMGQQHYIQKKLS